MLSMLVPVITLLALLGSGIMAGLFFAYSNSVMPALAKLPAPQGIAAMNHINVVIQNPLFLTIFMGTAVLALILTAAALSGWSARRTPETTASARFSRAAKAAASRSLASSDSV